MGSVAQNSFDEMYMIQCSWWCIYADIYISRALLQQCRALLQQCSALLSKPKSLLFTCVGFFCAYLEVFRWCLGLIWRYLGEISGALLRLCRVLLRMSMALLMISRANLQMCRALLRIFRTLLVPGLELFCGSTAISMMSRANVQIRSGSFADMYGSFANIQDSLGPLSWVVLRIHGSFDDT